MLTGAAAARSCDPRVAESCDPPCNLRSDPRRVADGSRATGSLADRTKSGHEDASSLCGRGMAYKCKSSGLLIGEACEVDLQSFGPQN